jgi:hypothetical protein
MPRSHFRFVAVMLILKASVIHSKVSFHVAALIVEVVVLLQRHIVRLESRLLILVRRTTWVTLVLIKMRSVHSVDVWRSLEQVLSVLIWIILNINARSDPILNVDRSVLLLLLVNGVLLCPWYLYWLILDRILLHLTWLMEWIRMTVDVNLLVESGDWLWDALIHVLAIGFDWWLHLHTTISSEELI